MSAIMPSAPSILWFLAAFLLLWSASLVWRGIWGDRARGKRRCPECRSDVPPSAGMTCPGCGFEASKERELRGARCNWRMIAGGCAGVPLAAAAGYAGYQVWSWTRPNSVDLLRNVTYWNSLAAAVGAFALVCLIWAYRGERSRGRRRCPRCWYDMRGSGLQCPECGHEVASIRGLYRPRRRWTGVYFAVFFLLVGLGIQGVPRVRAGGWRATVPTTAIIAGMTWLPAPIVYQPAANIEEDWTLSGRLSDERPWRWQRAWIARKTERLLRTESGSHGLRVGTQFLYLVKRPSEVATIGYVRAARMLAGSNAEDRAIAAECLDYLGGFSARQRSAAHAEILALKPGLMAALNDPNETPAVIMAAAGLLAECRVTEAAPRMIELIQGAGRMRAEWLAGSLADLTRADPSVRAMVFTAVETNNPAGADALMVALTSRGADSATIDRILSLVRNGSDVVALAAARGLTRSGLDDRAVIETILGVLDTERGNRGAFLLSLAYRYDLEMLPYLPRIIDAMEDPAPDVRAAAVQVLHGLHGNEGFRLDGSPAFPVLKSLANDPDPGVSRSATETLNWIGAR